MVAVFITGLFAAAWFAFASWQALRTLGDPVEEPTNPGRPPRYPEVRKDVGRASPESLGILIHELETDFDRAGLAFVEYWNPGADLLAFRFRLLHSVAAGCQSIAPGAARRAVLGMADIVEWGYRASAFVPATTRR